jgi:hypothetical protein
MIFTSPSKNKKNGGNYKFFIFNNKYTKSYKNINYNEDFY